ncbi:SDR family oxidoreductase [Pseudalkalibacillus decolorationis]|uniref:SDR family oxidoreductase n=1 Tax=Pseudalkalibacillus decolorationis TaxID=163879 RepID=UPI002147BFCB|nr:SDR family oxidoreductase [Pseudalkalibacillus decolorationis]
MKVLVAGANGSTGRSILNHLGKNDNHEAIAMVRDNSQAETLEKLGASTTILADLEKELDHAVEGCDAIIFAAGSGSKTGPDKTTLVDEQGAIKLIEAAEKHGVKRFVMLSTVGADKPEVGSDDMKHYYKSKGNADEKLINSSLVYTIVRPGRLSYDSGNGKIRIAEKLEDYSGDIPREDVAKVIVESLDVQNTHGKIFEILTGDQDINEALKSL